MTKLGTRLLQWPCCLPASARSSSQTQPSWGFEGDCAPPLSLDCCLSVLRLRSLYSLSDRGGENRLYSLSFRLECILFAAWTDFSPPSPGCCCLRVLGLCPQRSFFDLRFCELASIAVIGAFFRGWFWCGLDFFGSWSGGGPVVVEERLC